MKGSTLRLKLLALGCNSALLCIVGVNYAAHVGTITRSAEDAWGTALHIAGHAILALLLISWLRTLCAPYARLPADWQERLAAADIIHSSKSGVAMPPRAFESRDHILLGFDHNCRWLGVPVALHNRKFFIGTMFWGTALTSFAGTLSACDFAALKSDDDGGVDPSLLDALRLISSPLQLLLAAVEIGSLPVPALLVLLDTFTAAFLLFMFITHLRYVLGNVVSVDNATNKWDLGAAANLRQWLGETPALWLVPVANTQADGIVWPTRKLE